MDKTILIVKAGSTFSELSRDLGDFPEWIAAGLDTGRQVALIDARTVGGLPDPARFSAILVTGSHEMVSDRSPWSERLGAWMVEAVCAAVPLLGICYGHQLLAHALGGTVGYRAAGRELGTVNVHLTEAGRADPLFRHMPRAFPAHMVHEQSVLALPPEALCLAHSAEEPHQAFRVGKCAWGVQFHPEFSAAAMQGYLARLTDDAGEAPVIETREAAGTLRHFANFAA